MNYIELKDMQLGKYYKVYFPKYKTWLKCIVIDKEDNGKIPVVGVNEYMKNIMSDIASDHLMNNSQKKTIPERYHYFQYTWALKKSDGENNDDWKYKVIELKACPECLQ